MNKKKNCMIDILLALDFILLAFSGFAAHFAQGKTWAIIHSISSVVFIVLVAMHVIGHRKMIKAMTK
jgi:hypothetical protein